MQGYDNTHESWYHLCEQSYLILRDADWEKEHNGINKSTVCEIPTEMYDDYFENIETCT